MPTRTNCLENRISLYCSSLLLQHDRLEHSSLMASLSRLTWATLKLAGPEVHTCKQLVQTFYSMMWQHDVGCQYGKDQELLCKKCANYKWLQYEVAVKLIRQKKHVSLKRMFLCLKTNNPVQPESIPKIKEQWRPDRCQCPMLVHEEQGNVCTAQ
jgi:hypothetical protein